MGSDSSGCWGGDYGFFWIFALLLLPTLYNGGGMFGGNNGAVTEATLCNQNNFQQLENSVGRLNDAMAQQNMMIQQAACQTGYQTLEQFGGLQRDLCTGFANGVAATNAAAASARECCCETNRNIDAVRYDGAMNTASINANIDAKFAALEKAQLEQTIQAQQNQLNQLQLQAQLCGVVRYPLATTYAAQNPYMQGCCCAA